MGSFATAAPALHAAALVRAKSGKIPQLVDVGLIMRQEALYALAVIAKELQAAAKPAHRIPTANKERNVTVTTPVHIAPLSQELASNGQPLMADVG